MQTGVAHQPIEDIEAYKRNLSAGESHRIILQDVFARITPEQKRVVFEGEEEVSIRGAIAFRNAGYGQPILLGREARIKQRIEEMGLEASIDFEIINAKISDHNKEYIKYLYKKLQRKGILQRDCQRGASGS